ncbi:MAG: hypothetical protein Ct9H300mP1_00970 [Planctomycetaceae bacterium]|nr:MAG: hypothetical protein Ct9H300mP1_00970 [Planctomycetaceae bacterium]
MTNHAAQLLREHTPDLTRIHHVITAGGDAPNVVPPFGEVYYYIRHPRADVVRGLYERLVLCARAGALATETRLEIKFEGGIYQILPNNALSTIALGNLQELADLRYNDQEPQFALRLREHLPRPRSLDSIQQVISLRGETGRGSTDVGDVSWAVPTTGFSTSCWVPGRPDTAGRRSPAGGTTIARKGMQLAARVLAATAWDLYSNPDQLAAARTEHRRRIGRETLSHVDAAGTETPLDYRLAPSSR